MAMVYGERDAEFHQQTSLKGLRLPSKYVQIHVHLHALS